MNAARGAILPCLQPPGWSEAASVLCEPLIGQSPRWNDAIALPWIAYGVDAFDAFEFFEPDPARLVEMRAAARASLPALSFDLDLLDYDTFSVIDVHGSYFASESMLDPTRMREFEQRLSCDMLVVGIPCRGHAYITSGNQAESALRRFVGLVQRQHDSAQQPLFSIPVLVQRGEAIGLLRLASDDEFDGDETLLL
jgi:hypothetical protein